MDINHTDRLSVGPDVPASQIMMPAYPRKVCPGRRRLSRLGPASPAGGAWTRTVLGVIIRR